VAGRTDVVRRRIDVAYVLAGLIVFLLCASVARTGTVGPAEARVFHWINGLPGWLSPGMQVLQLTGVLGVGLVVAAGALAFRRSRLALAAILVTAQKLVAERLVWHVISRSRPGATIAGAIVRGNTPTRGASFVSVTRSCELRAKYAGPGRPTFTVWSIRCAGQEAR
jgi:hypothetical protein